MCPSPAALTHPEIGLVDRVVARARDLAEEYGLMMSAVPDIAELIGKTDGCLIAFPNHAHAARTRQTWGLKIFMIAGVTRIYSVALAILLLTVAIDTGHRQSPAIKNVFMKIENIPDH